jgi:NADH dehydrogenase
MAIFDRPAVNDISPIMNQSSIRPSLGQSLRRSHCAPARLPRVVIIGGGFGGFCAAQSMSSLPVQVTLLDRRNFHLFQPLLYQGATAWLSPANFASTLSAVLRYQDKALFFLAEVTDIDSDQRKVIFSGGEIAYDMTC